MVITKQEGVGVFLATPYIAAILNCGVWIIYCVSQGSLLQPLVTNVFGLSMNVVYLSLYIFYSEKRANLIKWSLGIGLWFGFLVCFSQLHATKSFVVYIDSSKTPPQQYLSSFVVGLSATVLNIFMYGAPLEVISNVIKTRSTSSLPFVYSVLITSVSMIWCVYGVYNHDLWITIPNVLGLMLAVVQMGLFCKYGISNQDNVDKLLVDSNQSS